MNRLQKSSKIITSINRSSTYQLKTPATRVIENIKKYSFVQTIKNFSNLNLMRIKTPVLRICKTKPKAGLILISLLMTNLFVNQCFAAAGANSEILIDAAKAGVKPIYKLVEVAYPLFIGLGGIAGYFLSDGDLKDRAKKIGLGMLAGWGLIEAVLKGSGHQ